MEAAPVPGAKTHLRGLLLIAFILIICAAYSNTLTSPPYLDDFHSFIFEKKMYLDELSVSSILSLVNSKFGYSRFIPVVTLALNHKLGQSNLIYFHAVNILIHILAFLAVYFLVRQIISAEKKRNPDSISEGMAGWLPICVAALWALSPVQTNSVTYLVQRMASLLGLFFFLSAGFYIKARMSGGEGGRKAIAWYACFAVSTLCAFLSKENSVLLPFSIVLIEIWFFDSFLLKEGWLRFRRCGWKIWLLTGFGAVVCLAVGIDALYAVMLDGYARRHFNLVERVLTEGRIVVWYISILLWPDPSRLSMEHYVELSTSLFSPLTTLPAFLAISGLLGGAVYLRKRHPVATFGILWFFLNISMESTIIPLELIFEHRLYVPSFGIFLSAAMLLALLFQRTFRKLSEADFVKAFCSVAIILASCSALMTFTRNADWETILSIQHDNASKAPLLPRANSGLANALLNAGQYDEAIKYAQKAIDLGKPGLECYGVATNALLIAHVKSGRHEEAIRIGEQFLNDPPKKADMDALPFMSLNVAQAHHYLGNEREAYKRMIDAFDLIDKIGGSVHKKDAARAILRAFLTDIRSKDIDLNGDGIPDPGDVPLDFWIAGELRKANEFAYSRYLIEQEYSRNPENPEVARLVAELGREDSLNRAQRGKWDFAAKYVRQPFSRFNFYMAVAFLVQEKQLSGTFQRLGERCLHAALEIDPQSPDALLLKGWYAFARDDTDEAVRSAKFALEKDRENAKAWLGLGFFLTKAGSAEDAIRAFNKVLEIYPGYSNRSTIMEICAQLEKGDRVDSFSENRSDSTVNPKTPGIPAT